MVHSITAKLLLAITLLVTTTSYKTPKFEVVSYCNENYSYCIDYPNTIFKIQEEYNNGRGCELRSFDNTKALVIEAYRNTGNIGLITAMNEQIEKMKSEGYTITQSKMLEGAFEITGLYNNTVEGYKMVVYVNNMFIDLKAVYQLGVKKEAGPIYAKIYRSLKVL
jgi:hypothetical protein